MIVHACHCRNCQRLTGGAFVINAWIEKSAVELISGNPASFTLQGGSGNPHDVYFCQACGTYVWSEYHRVPGSCWFVRVGTLDDPDLLTPDAHIYTRTKHPSVTLPADIPAFELTYDREAVWSAESLARLKASAETK
ncbi:MAG: GFA family protein [SAR324 cluster bacterium]|nr:GFA family protein [SAR324 cluster bacterium]